ncbi:MAG TPA: cellulase family glycosylhydrolase [Bradyrhizobium sp.]|nr:cellulase family glycosylhydrolase [Bradyrhizobium sp.]
MRSRFLFALALSSWTLSSAALADVARAGPSGGPLQPWPTNGVNLSLFPSGLNRHDTAEVASEINRQRVDQANSAGFRFIRLGIPFDAWTTKPDPTEQARVLKVVAATVHEAMADGLSLDVVPQPRGADLVCKHLDWDMYVNGLSSLLAQTQDSRSVAVEAMNEPPSCPGDNGPKSIWSDEQQAIYRIVRQKLPHATFVVTGPKWGNVDGMATFDPSPYQHDPYTLYAFHYYAPFLFTHQETPWLRPDHANQYVHDLEWPVTEKNRQAIEKQSLDALAADPNGTDAVRKALLDLFSAYRTEGSPEYLAERFGSIANWVGQHQIPRGRILIGEYGVNRVHLKGKPGSPWQSAPVWLTAVRDQAKQDGFISAVWDLDSGFGVICGDQLGHGELCPDYRSVYHPDN